MMCNNYNFNTEFMLQSIKMHEWAIWLVNQFHLQFFINDIWVFNEFSNVINVWNYYFTHFLDIQIFNFKNIRCDVLVIFVLFATIQSQATKLKTGNSIAHWLLCSFTYLCTDGFVVLCTCIPCRINIVTKVTSQNSWKGSLTSFGIDNCGKDGGMYICIANVNWKLLNTDDTRSPNDEKF